MRDYTTHESCRYHGEWFETGSECPSCLRNKKEHGTRSEVDQPGHHREDPAR